MFEHRKIYTARLNLHTVNANQTVLFYFLKLKEESCGKNTNIYEEESSKQEQKEKEQHSHIDVTQLEITPELALVFTKLSGTVA